MGLDLAREVAALALLAAAGIRDCRTGRVPNLLTLAGVLAGVILALAAGPAAYGSAGLGFAVGFGATLLLYLGGGMGGGDVKLMAGVGLLAGYPDIVWLLFYGGLAAAMLALGRLAWEGRLRAGLAAAFRRKTKDGEARPTVHFALAMALGYGWLMVMRFL